MENPNQNNSGFNSMVNNSTQQANQSTKDHMINKLDFLLKKYENQNFNEELVSVVKQLRRKRKEFDATRFFVLVVGPVKSGKSTLVNIFARKYVSPTAYKECTALPTIIGKSDREHLNKIIQYFPTESFSTEKAQKETFDYIVDVIREVEDHEVLNERVRKISTELTPDKIKEIVTLYHDEETDKKELVVSIGIEGGGFIDDEIMLIDMPGLDGGKKHKDNTLVYSNMAERADVVFFVQSTTSALNKASIDFLNKLFHEKKGKVPVWLIHNVHDSQYFLVEDDKKKADIQEQIEIGQKRVRDGFGIDKFDYKLLNLGKIYAAINEPDRVKPENREEIERTLEEYEKVENELIETLKKERQEIKDTINIGKATDTINESIEIVRKIIHETTNRKQSIKDSIDKMNRLSEKLDKVQIFDTPFLTEYDNLLAKEQIKNSWETKIAQIVSRNLPNGGDEIKGKDLKEKIDKITLESSNAMPVGMGTQFRSQLGHSLNTAIVESLKTVIDEIEQSIKEISPKETIHFTLKIDIEDLKKKSSNFESYYSDITEKERKIYLFGAKGSKSYEYSEQNDYLKIVKNYLIENIPLKLQEYRNILKDDFITIRDKFIAKLKAQINESAERYANEQKIVIEKLDQEIGVMNDMLEDLSK